MRSGILSIKKQANCEEDEKEQGDNWDHTAIDSEHRLLLSIVPGKRTTENCRKVVNEVKKRTNERTDILITSDEQALVHFNSKYFESDIFVYNC